MQAGRALKMQQGWAWLAPDKHFFMEELKWQMGPLYQDNGASNNNVCVRGVKKQYIYIPIWLKSV